MPYTLDDFLTFGPVFGKELQNFALYFAEQVVQNQDPVAVVKGFADNLKALYGIPRMHTFEQLGLLPLGLRGLQEATIPRIFSSPELEHDVMKQEAQEHKHTLETLGFRYEKNVMVAKCFLERLALLEQYREVRIAPAFLPMGSPMYVPEYVSLWVKENGE